MTAQEHRYPDYLAPLLRHRVDVGAPTTAEQPEPRFRVDLDGRVVPANEAAVAKAAELNARDREPPPWSWLVAGPVAKPEFDVWRMEGP